MSEGSRRSPDWSKTGPARWIGLGAVWWVTAWFVVMLIRAMNGNGAGEDYNRLIFADFFSAFLTAWLVPRGRQDVAWKDQSLGTRLAGGAGLVVILSIGAWLLYDLGGWLVILPWMAGIVASWNDPGALVRRAWMTVVWGFVSAFLVAMGASMAGADADADAALASDPMGTAAWGVLYFGGVAAMRTREVSLG